MKRLRRLGLLLGPMMVALILANMLAGVSPVDAAKRTVSSTRYTTAAACPTDASAITSMSVRITRNGKNTTVSNLSTVQPGDKVRVTFDLDNDCSNYRVSLVAYKAPDTSNNLDTLSARVVAASSSKTF